jgi:hypothetical protein
MTEKPNLQDVISLIEKSFTQNVRPGKYEIVSESAAYDPERTQIQKFLEDKNWHDVSLKSLSEYVGDGSAILSLLTPKAFGYFLPAFLKICVADYEKADVIVDTTFWKFLYRNDVSDDAFKSRLTSELTANQLETVAAAAKFLNANYGPDETLSEVESVILRRLEGS